LPETTLAQASKVAERIREKVFGCSTILSEVGVPVTLSVGAAEATLSMSGIEALMKASDQALYQAKATGRNRVVQFAAVSQIEPRLAAE